MLWVKAGMSPRDILDPTVPDEIVQAAIHIVSRESDRNSEAATRAQLQKALRGGR